MNWGEVFPSLRAACTLVCRTSPHTIGCSLVVLILSLAGCLQDSPPSSRERTVSLLLELLRDEGPEMRRMAAESLGKIGHPRAADSAASRVERPYTAARVAWNPHPLTEWLPC